MSSPFAKDDTRLLWTSCLKASDSTRLLSKESAALRRIVPMWEDPADAPVRGPAKPLALRFHFIEICGGTGKIGAHLRDLGFSTGPLLDLSFSPGYDWADSRIFAWVTHLVSHGLVDSVFGSPPCTTFSPAAYLPLRSYGQPLGFDPHEPRTALGNALAQRSIALVVHCHYHRVSCGIEQPRTSKMCWLRTWRRCAALPGAREVFTVGCAWGTAFEALEIHERVAGLEPCLPSMLPGP